MNAVKSLRMNEKDTAVNINGQTVQRLDTITKWMMGLLILIPFAISFGSLWGLADEQGVSWAWLYPLMIDGGLLIFKLLVLSASLRGESDRYSWFMAGLLTAISIGLNVAHVPVGVSNWFLSAFMFGLPPALILAAFIAVTKRVESQVKRETAVLSLDALKRQRAAVNGELAQLATQADGVQAETARLMEEQERTKEEGRKLMAAFAKWQAEQDERRAKIEGEISKLEAQRARVAERAPAEPKRAVKGNTAVETKRPKGKAKPDDIFAVVADDPDAPQAKIAEVLNMSEGWVSKWTTIHKEEGRLSQNGHGWEVHV